MPANNYKLLESFKKVQELKKKRVPRIINLLLEKKEYTSWKKIWDDFITIIHKINIIWRLPLLSFSQLGYFSAAFKHKYSFPLKSILIYILKKRKNMDNGLLNYIRFINKHFKPIWRKSIKSPSILLKLINSLIRLQRKDQVNFLKNLDRKKLNIIDPLKRHNSA